MNIFTQFCATMGAETKFEKARIAATYTSTNPPSEEDIRQILATLSGEDLQTNAQTAYSSLVRRLKLQNNDENGWMMIIKSLIIIDRCVSDRILLKEFYELDLPLVECRQERDIKNKQLLINELISKYYHYIKFKGLKLRNSTSLTLYKKEKILYFNKMPLKSIFDELKMILELVQRVFDIIETKKNGHLRFKVNQYVFLLLMNDLLKYYGCGLIAFNLLIKKLQDLQSNDLLQLIAISKSMVNFSNKFEEFIHQCRFIQGFESVQLDYKVDDNVVNLVTQYLDQIEIQKSNGTKQIKLNHYNTQAVLELISQQRLTPKQSEFFGNIMIKQPSKTQIFVNSFRNKFSEEAFQKFTNNYSSKYLPIHESFKKLPEIIVEEEIDFLQKVEDDQNKFHVRDTIDLLYPDPFDDKIFTQFQNIYNQ
ncbi:unnamed protein product [Paramecium pentaurelia]|uniref:AP180 N-terminal homology (ANTH) domain-containing protein n=1 Tax=Paramecium pentaurelia TaxID=43138 RepID=A0A8S1S1R3_9CILI|nr:unnamed protein product [Paramecium pentaurelia]